MPPVDGTVDRRWAALLTGNFSADGGSSMACRHQSPPFGRSAWRVCNDLGVLRAPRFDIGKRGAPPDEGCLAVSIGVGGSWELEDRLAMLGCAVHAFDPTHELHKAHAEHVYSRPRMHFHFLGLGGRATGSAAGSADSGGLYGAISVGQLRPLDDLFSIARAGRLRQAVDVLKIDCEGCEWDAFADIAQRTPMLLGSVQHILIELHLTPRYGLRSAWQLNTLIGHLVATHGFRVFRKLRKNRGFPWARNQTLPALVRAGVDPVACCTELHFSRPEHSGAFRSHAAWLARLEPGYVAAQEAAALKTHLSASTMESDGTQPRKSNDLSGSSTRKKRQKGSPPHP